MQKFENTINEAMNALLLNRKKLFDEFMPEWCPIIVSYWTRTLIGSSNGYKDVSQIIAQFGKNPNNTYKLTVKHSIFTSSSHWFSSFGC